MLCGRPKAATQRSPWPPPLQRDTSPCSSAPRLPRGCLNLLPASCLQPGAVHRQQTSQLLPGNACSLPSRAQSHSLQLASVPSEWNPCETRSKTKPRSRGCFKMNGALPEDVGQLAHVQTIHSIGFPCVRLHSPFKTQGNRKSPLPVSRGTGSLPFLPPPAAGSKSSEVFVGCSGSGVPKWQSHTTNSYLLATS